MNDVIDWAYPTAPTALDLKYSFCFFVWLCVISVGGFWVVLKTSLPVLCQCIAALLLLGYSVYLFRLSIKRNLKKSIISLCVVYPGQLWVKFYDQLPQQVSGFSMPFCSGICLVLRVQLLASQQRRSIIIFNDAMCAKELSWLRSYLRMMVMSGNNCCNTPR